MIPTEHFLLQHRELYTVIVEGKQDIVLRFRDPVVAEHRRAELEREYRAPATLIPPLKP